MKIGMLFPDYGSQYVGMGKELYDESRIVQEYFEEASNCLTINFVKLCFASSDAELSKAAHAYVSIFLISTAIAALLKQEGIIPSAVAGYGIGEFSAVNVVGGLSFPDGLYLLNKYAQFYQELLTTLHSAKASMNDVSVMQVQRWCKQYTNKNQIVTIAEILSKNSCVIAGHYDAVMACMDEAKAHKARCKEVEVEGGLHNELMQPIIDHLKLYCAKVDFKECIAPVISCVEAKPVVKGELIKNRLIKQLYSTIVWHKVLAQIEDWDIIVEIGPGSTLHSLIREYYPHKISFTINTLRDIEQLKLYIQQHQSITS